MGDVKTVGVRLLEALVVLVSPPAERLILRLTQMASLQS